MNQVYRNYICSYPRLW